MKKADKNLEELLKKEYQRMRNSKYMWERDYDAQAWRMISIISGYAPDMKVEEAWNTVREILHEGY